MNNMTLRAISGAIYVGLIIACIFLGNLAFALLVSLLGLIGINEVQTMMSLKAPISTSARVFDYVVAVILFGTLVCCGIYLDFQSSGAAQGYDAFMLIPFCAVFYIPARIIVAVCDKSENPLRGTLCSFLGLLYVVAPLIMLWLAYLNAGKMFVLWTFVLIWLNDTGAYLSGITMGRHKLCERLSPKKTWEGFIGGFCMCIIGGILIALFDSSISSVWFMAVYAAVVSILATYGDLFESLIKRWAGIKDSGNIIPGHGGVLDRIDSLLAIAPLAMLFSFFMVVKMFSY